MFPDHSHPLGHTLLSLPEMAGPPLFPPHLFSDFRVGAGGGVLLVYSSGAIRRLGQKTKNKKILREGGILLSLFLFS